MNLFDALPLRRILFCLAIFASCFLSIGTSMADEAPGLAVDAAFPGGNIVLDRIEGRELFVHQDLRDTKGDWFYWYFRVKGLTGEPITVHFTKSNVIGVRGPAVSRDAGRSWTWLGAEAVREQSFRYTPSADEREVRFAFAIPYVEANLKEFLAAHQGSPHLRVEELCRSKGNRPVERLHLGRLDDRDRLRLSLTCRHHACESVASYCLEGVLAEILSESETGRWFQSQVAVVAIPFVDKDGVEQGDQGKNRLPRDHNRDYDDDSLHPEVAAIRKFIPDWSQGRLRFAMDMHNPWIRGDLNEVIYFVENDSPARAGVAPFSRKLEAAAAGPLSYSAKHNLAFGVGWNTAGNYKAGVPSSLWFGRQPGIRFAATVEVPYADAAGKAITVENLRAFGRDLALAMRKFLEEDAAEPK